MPPPEQIESPHHVDIRSDLYSLGCTFYYALTGQDAFKAETILQLVHQHVNEEPKPIQEIRPEIPDSLAAIIHRLMQKDPNDRYQTPGELLGELEQIADSFDPTRTTQEFHLNPKLPECSDDVNGLPKTNVISRFAKDPEWVRMHDGKTVNTRLPSGHESAPPYQQTSDSNRFHEAIPTSTNRSDDSSVPSSAVDVTSATTLPTTGANLDNKSKAIACDQDRSSYYAPLWLQWNKVIEICTLDQQRLHIDENVYHDLYDQLVKCCRAKATEIPGEQHQLFQRMDSIVSPWVSPQILLRTDPATLKSLLHQCNQLTLDLGLTPNVQSRWPYFLLLALAGCTAWIAFWLVDITQFFPQNLRMW